MKKKSLISTLKTVKKANIAASPATNEGVSTRKVARKSDIIKKAKYRLASMERGKM